MCCAAICMHSLTSIVLLYVDSRCQQEWILTGWTNCRIWRNTVISVTSYLSHTVIAMMILRPMTTVQLCQLAIHQTAQVILRKMMLQLVQASRQPVQHKQTRRIIDSNSSVHRVG